MECGLALEGGTQAKKQAFAKRRGDQLDRHGQTPRAEAAGQGHGAQAVIAHETRHETWRGVVFVEHRQFRRSDRHRWQHQHIDLMAPY